VPRNLTPRPDDTGLGRARVIEQRPWPGITAPPCDSCTWAWLDGERQIKYINRAGWVHGRLLDQP
jgi:hypothetical protein